MHLARSASSVLLQHSGEARNGAIRHSPGRPSWRGPLVLPPCHLVRKDAPRRRLPSSSPALSSPAAASQCSAVPSGRWWKRNARNGALHVTVPGAANLRTRHPRLPDARTPAPPGRRPTSPPGIFTTSCVQVFCCTLQTCRLLCLVWPRTRSRTRRPPPPDTRTPAPPGRPCAPNARQHRPADVRRRHHPPGPG